MRHSEKYWVGLGVQGDGSCEYSDEVTGSESDVNVDAWMRREQASHEAAALSLYSGSQTSFRLSDFDRSTFYDYDDDDNNYNNYYNKYNDKDNNNNSCNNDNNDKNDCYSDDDDDDEQVNASSNSEESRSLQSQPHINEVTVVYVKYPDECCPKCCTASCGSFWEAFDRTRVGRVWFNWRNVNFILVEHKYFETFIIVMILISSLALVSQSINEIFFLLKLDKMSCLFPLASVLYSEPFRHFGSHIPAHPKLS